jgi:hypothetical protein
MWNKVVESGALGIKAMPLQPLYASSAVFPRWQVWFWV